MRLFVAAEFDDDVRNALSSVQRELASRCEGVRWIPPEQLHLTVKFLGEVRDGDVPKLAEAMAEACSGVAAFELTLAGCGCFPLRGPVRIVWAGGHEPTGALVRLADAIESAFDRLGFARERRAFSPHITIGRVREDRSTGQLRAVVEAQQFAEQVQAVDALTLMQSVLSAKGPTYTPVSRARLARPART